MEPWVAVRYEGGVGEPSAFTRKMPIDGHSFEHRDTTANELAVGQLVEFVDGSVAASVDTCGV
jgi:hypothetical protein